MTLDDDDDDGGGGGDNDVDDNNDGTMVGRLTINWKWEWTALKTSKNAKCTELTPTAENFE